MKVKIAILFVFVYCMSLLANLPAAIVVSFIPNNMININNVTGTLWEGEAKKVAIKSPKLILNNVKWDINLLSSLFSLTLEAEVSFYNGAKAMSGEGVVKYGLGGFSASNVLLNITSEELVPLLPMPLPAKITGDFSVVIQNYKQGMPYCENLKGKVTWNDAYVSSSFGDIDLASPFVDLSCIDGNISALITQKSEQLSTNLDVILTAGEKYQLSGQVKGTSKLAPSITQSLAWVGPVNDAGATEINFKGKL